MEQALQISGLRKVFRTKVKTSGLAAAMKSLVSPTYRNTTAVDNISFSVDRGEILAFVGPNGAGKSTTIKIVTGIMFPDSGDVTVLGLNPHRERKQLSYRIGTVFGQKSQLWYHLPPIDSFHLLADIYDLDRTESAKRIDFLTEVFQIGDYLRVPVRKLSLGERIRCEIAASLIHKPEILFLDEPTIGLDVIVKQRIRQLIRTINAEDRTTIFLTSHDTGDIGSICKRAIVINHGRIVWDDSVNRMKYSFFRKKTIALRLESPLKLVMDGVEILKKNDRSAKLEINLDRVELSCVIEAIMQNNRIKDMTVTNPPLDDVIAMIYSQETP
ncbi:MAG: ATP-binding cassette domain-containing protein [candidate division Zixibacteria bacterium]|nr:ATP-binding cassette domain-containing protein [candidate division Zixibacteria bacterium]